MAALAVVVPATQGSASTPQAIGNGCSETDPAAGCQGIVAGLSATPSAVTVSGRGQFSNLKVTVNQTANLTNQAVSVSWTGGSPTFSDPATGAFDSTFNGDYLQVFQCWGDPQASDPAGAGAGPLPSQCEFGGESSNPFSAYPIKDTGFEYSRVLSQNGWDSYPQLEQTPGLYLDKTDNYVIEPFTAVNGSVVDQQADYGYNINPFAPLPFWLNPYFSFATSNEVDFARTYSNGTGQQLFQVDTGLEAPGIGLRPGHPAGAGRRHDHSAVLVGGGPEEHTDRGEPGQRDQCEQCGHLAAHPPGVGQPDRHPVAVQPRRDQLLDQGQRPGDHRGRAGRAGRGRLAAGPVQPARQDALQLYPEQRRPGPGEPDRPLLRLGGHVGVLRPDPPEGDQTVEPGGLRAAHLVRGGGGVQHRTGPHHRAGRKPAAGRARSRRRPGGPTSTSHRCWWPGC